MCYLTITYKWRDKQSLLALSNGERSQLVGEVNGDGERLLLAARSPRGDDAGDLFADQVLDARVALVRLEVPVVVAVEGDRDRSGGRDGAAHATVGSLLEGGSLPREGVLCGEAVAAERHGAEVGLLVGGVRDGAAGLGDGDLLELSLGLVLQRLEEFGVGLVLHELVRDQLLSGDRAAGAASVVSQSIGEVVDLGLLRRGNEQVDVSQVDRVSESACEQ